jgi:hypothetical protein
MWWVKGQTLSPLVTTTTNPDVTDANGNNVAAGLGREGTIVLLGPGGSGIDYGVLSGGRLTIGGWLDNAGTVGLEGRGFLMQTGSFHRTFSSDVNGSPVIGLPIFDVSGLYGGGQNAIVASFPASQSLPAIFRGGETVISHTRLLGAEANGICCFFRSDNLEIGLLGGFRFADLREDLSVIGQSSNILPSGAGGGVAFLNNFYDGTVTSTDIFRARNQFYGGQIGARAEATFGKAFVNVTGKLALGGTHQSTDIVGFSQLQTSTINASTAVGGTYAVASNMGRRTNDEFSVIPEVELRLGYNITSCLRGFVGYNFMYWSNVARPGAMIDHNVDVRQVPTLPTFDPNFRGLQPGPLTGNTGFWAQGINFGMELRF